MRYAIIGSGALGALYGARLQISGHEVHFLLRSDYQHVKEHGLIIDSIWGNAHLTDIAVYNSSADMPACDVLCVCIKSTENHRLKELLTPLATTGTTILLLQNGLSAEEEISQLFPDCLIAGGLCFLCSNKIAPGHIHHLDYGFISLAALRPSHNAASMHQTIDQTTNQTLEILKENFIQASVPCSIQADITTARWHKLVWNIPFNGLCTIHNCDTEAIMKNTETRAQAQTLMIEVQQGAAACHCLIEDTFIEKMMSNTDKMLAYKPSMLLDAQHKRPLEIEYMYQRPLTLAANNGYEMTEVRRLYEMLASLP